MNSAPMLTSVALGAMIAMGMPPVSIPTRVSTADATMGSKETERYSVIAREYQPFQDTLYL